MKSYKTSMILVVGSSSIVVEYLTGILCNAGFTVKAASLPFIATHFSSGLQLVILISSTSDLQKICDMCCRIRTNGPELPVIVVGPDDTDGKVRLFGLGADDYIVEPFDRDEFLARVKALIRKQQVGFW
jgi:two-component system, OmpR family, response regulator TctD